MRIMIMARGGNTKPLQMVGGGNLNEPIYITTPQKLEETLYKVVDSVNPYNTIIDCDLIKDTLDKLYEVINR